MSAGVAAQKNVGRGCWVEAYIHRDDGDHGGPGAPGDYLDSLDNHFPFAYHLTGEQKANLL